MTSFQFHGQRENEEVISAIKNHPFVLFWPGLKTLFFLVLGIVTFAMIGGQIGGVVLVIMIIIALGIFFRAIYCYIQSVFVLTNQRIINVTQDGMLKRNITETEISRIQDVSSKTTGFFKLMLKFGDLVIRTAGAGVGGEIVVQNIAQPYEVQQKIASMKK